MLVQAHNQIYEIDLDMHPHLGYGAECLMLYTFHPKGLNMNCHGSSEIITLVIFYHKLIVLPG
jgi:hypothetical protein